MKLGNFRHGADVQFHRHTWAAIAGAAVSVAGSILTKPKAPAAVSYQPVNLGDTAKGAIDSNISNESSIEGLVSRGNQFNEKQALSLQEQSMPGYTQLSKSLSGQAQKLADNPYAVPADVQQNLSRIAAEKGISAGTRGQFNDFSLLRDLGVNELQYGQQNLSTAQGLTATLAAIAPKVNPMSPLSFYVTPAQAVGVTTNNNTQQQAIGQGAANANAAATNAGNADLWGSVTKLAGSFIGGQGGGGGGGTTQTWDPNSGMFV